MADRLVDCIGLACPLPVLRLAGALEQLGVGDVAELLCDDPGALVDIPVWCRLQDQKLLGLEELAGGGWRFRVRRAS